MQQPLLFVLEDLHWSDDASLELLLHLMRACRDLPILLLLTYRNDEATPELRHLLAEFDREHLGQEIVLQRLGRTDVEAMLHAIFAMHGALHTGLGEGIYELTEGNPFFIEEMLKALLANGEIISKEGRWVRTTLFGSHAHVPAIPRSVQDSVYQRTRQLSAPALQLLTLAAVMGRRFDLTFLRHLMQVDELQILALIKELVAAQLVTEESAEQFSFRHALTQQAVYTSLLLAERRVLHRAIAETIEQHAFPSSILDAQLIDLAHHFFAGADWTKAALYGQRAGERALILYAPRAAIEHLTNALAALKHLGEMPSASILRSRGQAYSTIGAFEQARTDYEQALSLAQQSQDGVMEWQCSLDLGFLWAERDYGQAGAWFHLALEQAQRLDDPRLLARSLNRFGNWLVNTGRVEESLHAHQQALALFETLQDREGMAETFDLSGMAHGMYGDTVKAVEHYKQAIALLRTLNDRHSLISCLAAHVVYASSFFTETTCSVNESREYCIHAITEALNLARQVDAQTGQAFVALVAGGFFASCGEFGRGLAHAQTSLQVASEIKHTQWMAGANFTLGRIYLLLLENNLAVHALETGLQLAFDIGSAWWIGNITAYLAQAYLAQGAVARAREVLQAVMPYGQTPRTSLERRMGWSWGELSLAEHEPDKALHIVDSLLASVPGEGTGQPIPWLLKLKGEALVKLARREEALRVLEEARQGALTRHEQPLYWPICRALGRLQRQLKQEEQAQNYFRAARETIASLASTIDEPYLREHFTQTALATLPREKALTSARAARTARDGLTGREREIVVLIAQGKSNREIADALIVTKRTVETHINNILSKINVTSRTQIVVWALEHGLTTY